MQAFGLIQRGIVLKVMTIMTWRGIQALRVPSALLPGSRVYSQVSGGCRKACENPQSATSLFSFQLMNVTGKSKTLFRCLECKPAWTTTRPTPE